MISNFRTTAITAAVALGTCQAAGAAPLYHLTDLGAHSAGWSINATGEIAGWDNDQRAAFYKDGAWHRVEGHVLQTYVAAVNDSGILAGSNTVPANHSDEVATRWNATGHSAPITSGMTTSQGLGIRKDGTIWGVAQQARETPWVFTWRKDVLTNLGGYPTGGQTTPTGMNAKGQIAGTANTTAAGDSPRLAVTCRNGAWTQIPGFGGGDDYTDGINNQGVIIGSSKLGDGSGTYHPFSYDGTTLTDLGMPATATSANLRGINDGGAIVGGVAFSSADADGYATLWTGGQRHTLEDLLDASSPHVHLEQGMAINDAGQIVAMSWYLPGESGTHAFLLTPVSQ